MHKTSPSLTGNIKHELGRYPDRRVDVIGVVLSGGWVISCTDLKEHSPLAPTWCRARRNNTRFRAALCFRASG